MNTSTPSSNITAIPRQLDLARTELIVLVTAFAFAVIGNGCVVCVLLPRWKSLARVHHFMLNLSIADLFVAFGSILTQLLEDASEKGYLVVGGDPLCKFVRFMQIFPVYGSSYVLLMCAIDRYIAICHPLKNYSWTNKRTYTLVLIAWCISFALALPQFFLFTSEYDVSIESEKCTDKWSEYPEWAVTAYTFYYLIFTFFIPLIILIFAYGSISYTVWINVHSKTSSNKARRKGERSQGQPKPKDGEADISVISSGTQNTSSTPRRRQRDYVLPRTHSKRSFSRAKLRTVALTFVVVCAFIICWAPFCIIMTWWALDEDLVSNPAMGKALTILALLTSLNSCCNPYIYLFFTFSTIKRFFPCSKRRRAKFPTLTYSTEGSLNSTYKRRNTDTIELSCSNRTNGYNGTPRFGSCEVSPSSIVADLDSIGR